MRNPGDNRGVTLIELILVVTIIGILIIALGFSFQGWMGRYKVESTTKQIYVDLMNARARAIQSNRAHFVDFPTALSYRIIEDTNENNASNPGAGDTLIPNPPKTVEYTITNGTGGTTVFDRRGTILSPLFSSAVTQVAVCLTTTATSDSDYDCIELSQTKLNIGKLTTQISNGGACDAANCVAK